MTAEDQITTTPEVEEKLTPDEIEQKAKQRPAEAKLIRVIDQSTLDLVGDRLTANKALQKQATAIFKPIKQKMDAAKQEVLDQEKRVMRPLEEEESLLKTAIKIFQDEQDRLRRIEEDRLRREQAERQREEMRLAEERRLADERALNEQLEREHAEEVERQLDALPVDVAPEVVVSICNTPAPQPVRFAAEMPVFEPIAVAPERYKLPTGIKAPERWKPEVYSVQLLCKAIADGIIPAHYVLPNLPVLGQLVRANKQATNIPGVRAVRDTSISAGSR